MTKKLKEKYVWIVANGILTKSEDASSWNSRACRKLRADYGLFAEAFKYFTIWLSRAIMQSKRVKNMERFCADYHRSGMKVNMMGHSNGASIAVQTVARGNVENIGRLVLIAGACENDFNKNGLNKALKKGTIEDVVIFVSKHDKVLRKTAGLSRKLFGWIGKGRLAFGQLGYLGPVNVAPSVKDKVRVVDGFDLLGYEIGHSDWVSGANLDITLEEALT